MSATNVLGITNIHFSENKAMETFEKLKPEKMCKKIYIIALVIFFLYACTDRYHHIFVKGKTEQFIDILINRLNRKNN